MKIVCKLKMEDFFYDELNTELHIYKSLKSTIARRNNDKVLIYIMTEANYYFLFYYFLRQGVVSD